MRYNPGPERGFSLLEIVVAFAIGSVLLAVLLSIFSTGARTVRLTDDYARAVQIAESILATVTAENTLTTDVRQGVLDADYSWVVEIEPYLPADENWNADISVFLPYQIRVEIDWGEPGRKRHFSLKTLRLQDKTEAELE